MKIINILVIEDSDSKRQSIQNVVERELPTARLFFAQSVRSGIDAISADGLDLIIADMSLPTYDIEVRERGGTPRPFGGIEIFEHLERVEIQLPVLVVTSYPAITDGKKSMSFSDLSASLRLDFEENFLDMIYFDSSYTKWDHEISAVLGKLFKEE